MCWIKGASQQYELFFIESDAAIGAAKPALVEQPRQVVSRETTTRPNTAEIETQPIFMLQTIQVSEYESLLPSLVEVYRLEADFQAGQLPYFVNEWRALTSDTKS